MPTATLPSAIRPAGAALHYLQMSGAFYCRSTLTAPFGLALPPLPGTLMFHLVASGGCRIEVPGAPAKQMRPGDLVLVPHGAGHDLLSEPGRPCTPLFDIDREHVSERYEILEHGGGGERTTMLCGAVRFDHPAAARLVRVLPKLIHVDSWTTSEAEWLQSTLRFIAAEAASMRLGGETIITRLCDVVVIQALRAWVRDDPAAQTGWLGALQDPQLGPALAAIHAEPARAWTVEALASQVLMSRSAFAAKFTDRVGETPMKYVTSFRMATALGWLREGERTIASVAHRLGYQSEAAFSRAFKRCLGFPPGRARHLPA